MTASPSDINTLHAKLAIHTGTSAWTFDVGYFLGFLSPRSECQLTLF
jgi:hypothetical protein